MYSEDLLWRIIWLMMNSFNPEEVAWTLYVSVPTVYRVWRLYEDHGEVRISDKGKRKSMISDDDAAFIEKMVLDDNALFLDEYLQIFQEERGFAISSSTLLRVFHAKGITRKRLSTPAHEASEEAQSEYMMKLANIPASCFVFIDEVRCDKRNANRLYGRNVRGTPARKRGWFVRKKRYSSIGMMACDEWLGQFTARGPINSEDLCFFAENYLIPSMNPWSDDHYVPRSCVVMDNCKTHYNVQFHRLLADAGIKVIFLPSYSPQFNPIELAFSKVKKFLNRHMDKLLMHGYDIHEAICIAFESITPSDCAGWTSNCGYDFD